MNHSLAPHAKCYVAIHENKHIAFAAVISFPSGRKKLRKISRIVVKPEYQGLGIGVSFISALGEHYIENNLEIGITTTLPAFMKSLKKSKDWRCIRYGKSAPHNEKQNKKLKSKARALNKTTSTDRITASFAYKW